MWLTVRGETGASFAVGNQGSLIGRDESCDFVVQGDKVSRRHARITARPDGSMSIEDLGSTNGTYVNGRRIEGPVVLAGNELIRLGDTELVISMEDPATATPGPLTTDPRAGTTIAHNKYRILDRIQEGGMGVVYLAERVRVGDRVALKVLAPQYAEDQRFRQRFEREWRAAAALEHPNILPVWDVAAEDEPELYIAMPYIKGGDLRAVLEREGPIAPERAIAILAQVASALDAAHAHGLIHRDVKPSNVLISSGQGVAEEGRAFLCDFGITKSGTEPSGLTETGQTIGTVHYMAPEQIKGELPPDPRTDEYALGCVLYECLTGQVPYEKDSGEAIKYAHVHDPPPRVTAIRPELPPALDQVIGKAMAKAKEDRYQTCGEMIAGAKAALAGTSFPVAAAPAPMATTQAGVPVAATAPGGSAMGERPTTVGGQPPAAAAPLSTPSRAPLLIVGALLLGAAAAGGILIATRHHGNPAVVVTTTPPTAVTTTPPTTVTTTPPTTTPPTTNPPTTVPGPAGLTGSIPASIRDKCAQNLTYIPDASLETQLCTLGADADGVYYVLFGSNDDMYAWYQRSRSDAQVASDSGRCGDGFPGEGTWHSADDVDQGRIYCYIDSKAEGWIVWTLDRDNVLAYAYRTDGNDTTLFTWWQGIAQEQLDLAP